MLYPLKFEPILKHRIWGGNKLERVLGKKHTDDQAIGESWELSGMPGDESLVVNGVLAGNSLSDLLEIYMDDLVGTKVFDEYGFTFPLLFKFIDANEKLSIQVHPSDELAEEHNCFGKTEMWYVIDAEEGAEVVLGFTKKMDKDACELLIHANKLESVLKRIPVKAGDVFFIPAGLVHAIGKGVLLAEVQQASDLTYRMYDYNRLENDGKPRQLHQAEALDAIDFENTSDNKVSYPKTINDSTLLVNCDYFTTNLLRFDKPLKKDYANLDSFVVYMCLAGSLKVKWQGGEEVLKKGETLLIPAEMNEFDLIPNGNATIIEVFVGAFSV